MAIYWLPPGPRPEISYDPSWAFEGALPPGIYCEDEAARVALMKGASQTVSTSSIYLGEDGPRCTLNGTPVYVATPAQLEFVKAMPATTPEQARAEQAAREAAAAAAWTRLAEGFPGLSAGLPERRASRPAPPVPPTRHPFRGANRAQRRAMAAEERRRA